MRTLSLFSGGGLGDLGFELAGMEIVGQVEIDDYCQKILKLRWPEVPKWMDIKNVKASEILEKCGAVDLISGGFPCQDISGAKQNAEGISGKRSGLWKEYFRLVCDLRPKYVLVENVSALLYRGLDVVLGDLAQIGYDAEWQVFSSCQFGATHTRERVFILAYPIGAFKVNTQLLSWNGETSPFWIKDSDKWSKDWLRSSMGTKTYSRLVEEQETWEIEPGFLRVVNGSSETMDRLGICGNGQQVQVVEWIGKRILEFNSK